jgi:hypothetical protein
MNIKQIAVIAPWEITESISKLGVVPQLFFIVLLMGGLRRDIQIENRLLCTM